MKRLNLEKLSDLRTLLIRLLVLITVLFINWRGQLILQRYKMTFFRGNYVLFLLIFNCLIVLPSKNENRIKRR